VSLGVKKGISDIFLPYPNERHNGLYIELKTETGTVSKEQNEFLDFTNESGYLAVVCRSKDEAVGVILDYLRG